MSLKSKSLRHEIQKELKRIEEVRLVYLFGSQARGDAGLSSDYDFAVLTDRAADPEKIRAALAMLFSRTLETDEVDVVMLLHAPIELAYAIIATGDVVYEPNLATRVDYEAYVLGLYGDYLPILRAQREDLLKGDPYEARVQRYRKAIGRTERAISEAGTFYSEKKGRI